MMNLKTRAKLYRLLPLLSIVTLLEAQWGQQTRKGFVDAASFKATTATVSSLMKKNEDSKLLQFPLIPHHVKFPNVDLGEVRHRYLQYYNNSNNTTITNGAKPVQMGTLFQGYGTHYIDLWVGTPNPQRQTLIVSTGSGVAAFPCSSCASYCGEGRHIDNVFQEEKSETFQQISCLKCQAGYCSSNVFPKDSSQKACKVSMHYAEGSSWTAFEATDVVYFGGPHDHALVKDDGGTNDDVDPNHAKAFSFNMMFGCQTSLTGLFRTQLADGILGMSNAPTSFWRQMHQQKMIPHENFSLCLTHQNHVEREGTSAGALTMGGTDKRLHMTPMVFTEPRRDRSLFFKVHVRHVYLRHFSGGESSALSNNNRKAKTIRITQGISESELNHGNVVIDSGTTDTYFSRVIAQEFQKAYRELTGMPYTHEPMKSATQADISKLPTILIQLAGDEQLNKRLYPNNPSQTAGLAGDLDPQHPYDVIVAIPPTHYMEYSIKLGGYVARFYMDAGRGSTLGCNMMMGHDVYFDGETQQIGFAESTCDYPQLVQETIRSNTTKPPVILHPIKEKYTAPIVKTPKTTTSGGRMTLAVLTTIILTILIVGAILGRNRFSQPSAASGNDLELHRNNVGQYRRCPGGDQQFS